MATPTTTVWSAQPHTLKKLDLIRLYAGAWLPIMSLSGHPRLAVIDGFSGPGEYLGPDGTHLDGSPIVLLRELLEHSQFEHMSRTRFTFIFVDNRADRVEHLRSRVKRLGPTPSNIDVVVRHGAFHQVVPGAIEMLGDGRGRYPPTLALVDPFGYADVPFGVIADILSHPKSEAIVTFMVDSVNRFLDHEDHITQAHLTQLLDAEPAERTPILDAPNRFDALRDFYSARLRRRTDFVRPFRMLSDTRPIYDLLFATSSLKGLQKMKEAMWKVDPVGGCSFADATAQMDTLFPNGADTGELRRALVTRFRGQEPTIDEVERFTLVETAYHRGHLKQRSLKVLESEGRIEYVPPTGPPRRRNAGQYPSGCQLRFVGP